ncbi:hypothetical protein JYK02_31805 [Corallococcus macrosporus]|uniref:DUF2381 family protein n=1 Tax=Corallococcus macrosporus TaxID=35 RepID=A0ABS3DL77_9BACT|nr:hypothetical protein [Corallococcus macrosporus]MBN8232111.1 hypothetical protein [Corallococcus macrosporus]
MRMPLVALALVCAAPVSAEPPPTVLVAQETATEQDGHLLMPVLEYKAGQWQALTTQAALRAKGPTTWSGFVVTKADGSDLGRVALRTDAAVKPFQPAWGDALPGTRIQDGLKDDVVYAVSLGPKDDRARIFTTPPEGPLRDALTRKVLAAFPSGGELGQRLQKAAGDSCEGAGGWTEQALSAQELAMGPYQMMACARGTAERPQVCHVRFTRRMVSTKAACIANVWVQAWVVGTPEKLQVLRLDQAVHVDEKDISGERASVLLELDGRLFALTRPICYEGCDQLSVVEVGARDVKTLATGPEMPMD